MKESKTLVMLSNLAFLNGIRPEVLERLAKAAIERNFQPGQVILEEGSTGREIYLIVEGLVEVVKGPEETLLARRVPGDVVGEMGFIESHPRFATVRALEPTLVLELSEAAMSVTLAEQPELLYRAIQMLSARLRQSDLQMIADLQRKNLELERAYRDLQEAQAALVEKERMERELELARDLQQSILPRRFPRLPGFSCAARYRPAREVGGDFYDVIPLGKGLIGLVMADVSGKGMAAALFMGLTRSLLRAEAKRSTSPRRVLLNVNRLLLEMSAANTFVTVFYGVLNVAKGRLRFARAGHDYPLLFSPSTGECRYLKARGSVLGLMRSVNLEEVHLDLNPGDLLVFYTDGITDANSPASEFFSPERLRQVVCTADKPSATDLCNSIFDHVEGFQAGAVQFDDMAVLVVRMTLQGLDEASPQQSQ